MSPRAVAIAVVLVAIAVAAAVLYRTMRMPGRSFRGTAPPAERTLVDELRADVYHLGGTIGERNRVATPEAFDETVKWIEESFRRMGYQPKIDEAANIEVEIRGSDDIVVIGAHYDTILGSPGADDNGSGVAALLALARRFAHEKPARTLRFVAFANEEPPYFTTEQMGSWIYAKGCHDRHERIVAMISIETIGYYRDTPGSQQYPAMLNAVYPTTGNFVAFASNLGSHGLLQRCVEVFRAHAAVPSEGAALPEDIPGIGWSDQWSFWRFGYDAIMVTDTALFRNPHYHQRSDLPDTLDYERMARVVEGLMAVVRSLATP